MYYAYIKKLAIVLLNLFNNKSRTTTAYKDFDEKLKQEKS